MKINNKIIIGSISMALLFMILPSIPAVEFNSVKEAMEEKMVDNIKNIDLEELKLKIQSKNIDGLKDVINDNSSLTLFFPIAGIVFYSLIFLVLGLMPLRIFNKFMNVLKGGIGTTIGTILDFFLKIVRLIFRSIAGSMDLVYKTLGRIASFISKIIRFIFSFFIGTMGLTLKTIGKIVGFIFKLTVVIFLVVIVYQV